MLHRSLLSRQQVECIHLSGFEWIVVAEQIVPQVLGPRTAAHLGPGSSDPNRVLDVNRIIEVNGFRCLEHCFSEDTDVAPVAAGRSNEAGVDVSPNDLAARWLTESA